MLQLTFLIELCILPNTAISMMSIYLYVNVYDVKLSKCVLVVHDVDAYRMFCC